MDAGGARGLARPVADPPPRPMRRPMLLFQGPDDKVVPPSQLDVMEEAFSERGLPYVAFRVRGGGPRVPAAREPAGGLPGRARVPRPRPRVHARRRHRADGDRRAGLIPLPGPFIDLPESHEHPRRARVPVHVGVGHRRPPRQDVRPDLGRHPRRDPADDPDAPRRLRDGHDDRARACVVRRDHDRREGRVPEGRPRRRSATSATPRRERLRLPDLRHDRVGQGAVARHRPGRRRAEDAGRTARTAPATRG